MIAYYEMYLEMKFQIFSSVKSIVIIKKIKISLRSQHLTDMIKHVSGIPNATKARIRV